MPKCNYLFLPTYTYIYICIILFQCGITVQNVKAVEELTNQLRYSVNFCHKFCEDCRNRSTCPGLNEAFKFIAQFMHIYFLYQSLASMLPNLIIMISTSAFKGFIKYFTLLDNIHIYLQLFMYFCLQKNSTTFLVGIIDFTT